MSSPRLRKYLAYYQRTLSEEPENIEARLRLAALFCEMGRPRHAIEEYGTAAKLLAAAGLPLEAIAACKAILEMDASHTETQFFLARLYAQAPEATGHVARVARPVDGAARRAQPTPTLGASPAASVETSRAPWPREGSGVRVQALSEQEAEEVRRGQKSAITLGRPKSSPGLAAPASVTPANYGATPDVHQEATRHVPALTVAERDDHGEVTRVDRPRLGGDEPDAESTFQVRVFEWEGLQLDEASDSRWEALQAFDAMDEPPTMELREEDAGQVIEERHVRRSELPAIPLFSQLPAEAFVEALRVMEHRRVAAGTVLASPDDPKVCLYVIIKGSVRVEKSLVDGRTVFLARLGEGEVFGEFRLLTGRDGMARVVAEEGLEVLAVRDEVVYELGRRFPEVWDALWGFYYARMLNNLLASSAIFGGLSPEQREVLGRHFELREWIAGQALFERGHHVERLSLVVSGSVEVEVAGRRGQREVVDTLEAGAFLGVTPCAQLSEAGATVRARTDVIVLELSATIFRDLLSKVPSVGEAVRREVALRKERSRQARARGYASSGVAPPTRR
ncbi:cyclic nucleotide-binding domain-containing protein [Lujinxingia vulgaris]|uniref:Cyclic nucleotide-binding domain-containing protein n=1 Tax=Lujinxingia vulgaris TaxID=2600176 RepID=A0A5C6XDL5_9DELT|nr:cyclic nucleotide-binding domain-containing protein [Lujinxingia vulgaris]TXD37871.1 cyclic nucleotide-binding domain-containing protein [Lujinxingia vulgaris]